jgi:hypothetical protein
VLNRNGQLARAIRVSGGTHEVLETDVEALRSRWIVDNPENRQEIEQLFQVMPFPATFPPYSRALFDDLGCIWIERFRRPIESTTTWIVVGEDGASVAALLVPENLHVLDVSSGGVLVLWRDYQDVEHVRFYQVIKPSSGAS